MERHIVDSLPEFRMLDYQVNYDNHDVFSDVGRRKRKGGSPVRIFTNLPLARFDLSGIPGYKFCDRCAYWVSSSNKHCNKCSTCPSKNGMSYVHCDDCGYCVKPSYAHCSTCLRCLLPTHICGQFTPDTSCYHCHQHGHKKSQCPDLQSSCVKVKKRKLK